MVASSSAVALATLFLASTVSAADQILHKFTYTGPVNSFDPKGCFSDPGPLKFHGSYEYQSSGNCQKVCYGFNYDVMAMTSGNECWCGNLLPPKSLQVDMKECSTTCSGYDLDTCKSSLDVWNTFTG
jgi:cell wall integrity and stress response component